MPKHFSKEAFASLEAKMNAEKNQPESSDEDSLPEINEEQICSICLEEVCGNTSDYPVVTIFTESASSDGKKLSHSAHTAGKIY